MEPIHSKNMVIASEKITEWTTDFSILCSAHYVHNWPTRSLLAWLKGQWRQVCILYEPCLLPALMPYNGVNPHSIVIMEMPPSIMCMR